MIALIIPDGYFSETTLSHLKPQQGLPMRYQRRAQDVTLACKLTHVYGKYHLAMLHRQLAMSDEQIAPWLTPHPRLTGMLKGTNKGRLTIRRSAWSFRNSVGWMAGGLH